MSASPDFAAYKARVAAMRALADETDQLCCSWKK